MLSICTVPTTLIVHPKAAFHSTALIDINNLNTLLGASIKIPTEISISSSATATVHSMRCQTFPEQSRPLQVDSTITAWLSATTCSRAILARFRTDSFIAMGALRLWIIGTKRARPLCRCKQARSDRRQFLGEWIFVNNGTFKDIVFPNGKAVIVRGISASGIITGDGFTAKCQ